MNVSEQGMVGKLIIMLEMQDAMNSRVDADWLERSREWYRAIWIECAELMDHYGGWKWWKSAEKDVEQVVLEIIDIWHFGLSMRITAARDYRAAAEQIAAEWCAPLPSSGFLRDVEKLAAAALSDQTFAVNVVPSLLADVGRGFDDLYAAYVGKNVLNFFRQDHGYKDGTYIKSWDGREDNVHLVEVMAAIDLEQPNLRERVYEQLVVRYRNITDI